MRKVKLYIDTSGWNFYYADDAPEKRDITREFFEGIFRGAYDIYISQVVIDEIEEAPEPRRKQLFELIEKCSATEIAVTEEAQQLAEKYIQKGIVPPKKEEDALHVGIATVAEMDALITWNYRHMATLRRSELFHSVNLEQGYTKRLEIITPMGVGTDEN